MDAGTGRSEGTAYEAAGRLSSGVGVHVLRGGFQLGVPSRDGVQYVVEGPRQTRHSHQQAVPSRNIAHERH